MIIPSAKQKTIGTNHSHNFTNRYIPQQQLPKPDCSVLEMVKSATQTKVNEIVSAKTQTNFGTKVNKLGRQNNQYVKFVSKGQSGLSQKARIVKIQEAQTDPFNPSGFKHKKIPRGAPQDKPPQILRSPQRNLTQKDYDDWKVPPCISNYVNNKGYVIPLQMRLPADGRTLQTHTLNQRFADFMDTLYVAQQQSRQQLQEHAKINKSVNYKQHLLRQQMLKATAQRIRQQKQRLNQERLNIGDQNSQEEERQQLRYIRNRQIQRQQRLKHMGSKRKQQLKQRQISQKINLKRPQPTPLDDVVDQRVFDQQEGLDQGFGQSDEQNVFDKPLFQSRKEAVCKVRACKEDQDQIMNQWAAKGINSQQQGKKLNQMKSIRFQKFSNDLDSFLKNE